MIEELMFQIDCFILLY